MTLAAAPAPQTVSDGPVILAVTINDAPEDEAAMVLRRADGLWASARQIDSWRLVRPEGKPIAIDGEDYLPLGAIPGLRAEIDEQTQTLKVTVSVDRFVNQTLLGNRLVVPKVTTAIPAAFLNYNVVGEVGTEVSRVRGFFETGFSNRLGLAASTFTVGKTTFGQAVTRLDTFLMHDETSSATRLTIGDAFGSSTAWSRPIRFGGVKYGTDFGLRPGFVTFPTADFRGRTTLPSNVEVFANGALRYRGDLDRGPFAIDQAPIPVGAGTLTVVTRNILGVEQRTVTPYYVSSNLLRKGLSRYSIEVGAERDNYALRSFDYNRPFVAGQWRGGLTDWLTVESRGEFSTRTRTLGGSVATAWARLGEFGATIAASKGDGEDVGLLYGAYFSRVSPTWDLSINAQKASRSFTQLGVRQDIDKILRQIQANAGITFKTSGRVGVSLASLKNGRDETSRVASANYSINVGKIGFLDAFALRASSSGSKNTFGFGVGLTIPLGERTTARGSAELQNGHPSFLGDYHVTPPTDEGWGYGGSVRVGEFAQQRADATWRTNIGEFRADVAHLSAESGVRLTAEGGVVLANGGVFPTRRLDGSFGIIDAGGYQGVRVYQDNQPRTRTNRRGLAIIPALRPYETNAIRLSADDLPIGARVDADDILLVPAYRAGVLARFAVRSGHPATVIVRLPNGEPVLEGASVTIDGGRETTFTGYDGEVFVSDLKPKMHFDIDLGSGKRCTATVTSPESNANVDLPQIGPVVCSAAATK